MITQAHKQTYSCRIMQPDDSAQVRNLFREVFKQEMSPEFWHWKYGQATGCATVVFAGDKLIAHYGGMGRRARWQGRETQAVQITDVMVAPAYRHAVRSHSPFYLAFTTFAQQYLGYDKPWPLAYGFPNQRVMQLAQLLGFYAPVDTMVEINWPVGAAPLHTRLLRRTQVTQENYAQLQPKLDAVWQAMARSLQDTLVGVKDAAWLRQRYLLHPVKQYEVVLVQALYSLQPLGVVVLRQDENASFLMDVVADVQHIPALLQVAACMAAERGKATLQTWCCTSKAEHFATSTHSLVPLPIMVPANVWTAGPTPQQLQDQWWLMPGDTDFQ